MGLEHGELLELPGADHELQWLSDGLRSWLPNASCQHHQYKPYSKLHKHWSHQYTIAHEHAG
jgi:hypothetical protein